jgi:hypothetical protein
MGRIHTPARHDTPYLDRWILAADSVRWDAEILPARDGPCLPLRLCVSGESFVSDGFRTDMRIIVMSKSGRFEVPGVKSCTESRSDEKVCARLKHGMA